ncbi:hypothetical protein [Parasphingorhabdus sp.]|uniref:hypothetical protein n=1 Tax=Parasphingorhabdus sp. TaxID=2709688 RepID=UPI002F93B31F
MLPDDPLFEEAHYPDDARPLAWHDAPPDFGPDPAPDLSPPLSAEQGAGSPLAVRSSAREAPARGDARDFVPAERERQRCDGWTPQRQRDFIGMLADTGCVSEAAKSVGMSASGAYQLRRSPEGKAFAYAWEMAMAQASRRLVDVAFERAVKGVEDPVFDRDGQCTYVRRKYNDRLLMFLLRAHNPAQYGTGDDRIVDLDDREDVEDWSNGYTPLTAALEVIHPTLEDNVGEADSKATENPKMAE